MKHFTLNYWQISLLILGLVVAIVAPLFANPKPPPPIRIGVLHSLSGTMATSEKPLIDAVRLAVNEINASHDFLNRSIEIVVADGQSDPTIFAQEAERLITQENVSVIFGCWTSASRKTVKSIVEKYNHLLFYPVQYEGLEQSPNIIYTGSVANQQIIPATRWALRNLGKRVFLIGSEYIFPRTANRIITDFVRIGRGQIVGENYLPLDSYDIDSTVQEIEALKPDVIFNTINGDTNAYFLYALMQSTAKEIPVLSFSFSENELKYYPSPLNHYAAWSYFQSLGNFTNQQFVANYKQLNTDTTSVTSDPIESAYFGVYLWAQAAKEAKSFEPEKVNPFVLGQSVHAPSTVVSIDKATRHTWKMLRIGKAQADGQFKEIYSSKFPIRPEPFPDYRLKSEWIEITNSFNNGVSTHD